MWLRDHRILITGGSSGIGLALALAFLERGNQVLAVARSEDRLEAVAERFPRLQTAPCDVSNETALRRLMNTVVERLGGLSILVNNAGIQHNDDYASTNVDTLLGNSDREIETHLTGLAKLTALSLPLLRDAAEGAIVNVSSILALAPKRVFEAVPPLVDTAMTRGRSGNKMAPEAVAEEVLGGMASDRHEIQVGRTRMFAMLHRLAPALADRSMRRR
jgi:short-subunit dehydrogenase involved in D-alanine esterification of teichoic acids